jgi:D-hexose-6-phosphate mutarotase
MIDRTLGRTIKIEKSGSHSTVVWNPWLETAAKMNDLGPVAWQKMACVESANALDNFVTLEPGGQHTLRVKYSSVLNASVAYF